jgi:hypothetical protein
MADVEVNRLGLDFSTKCTSTPNSIWLISIKKIMQTNDQHPRHRHHPRCGDCPPRNITTLASPSPKSISTMMVGQSGKRHYKKFRNSAQERASHLQKSLDLIVVIY